MQEQVKGFESLGFKPEVKPLTFFQDDYGLKIEAGDEDDDDEEEEDGSEDEDDDDEEEGEDGNGGK